MYCPKCGTQNPEDAKVCLSCSQPLSALSQAPQTGAKTSALAKWSLALAIMGLYFPFMYLVVLPSIGKIEIQHEWWMLIIGPILLSLNPPHVLLFGIATLIICLIALSKIKKSKGTLKGKGLAAIATSISIIELGFVIFLNVTFFMGEFGFAQRIECRKNLSSLGGTIKMYTQKYQMYPSAENWQDTLIKDYNVNPSKFHCPESDANEEQSCYAININVADKKVSEVPPDTVLLFETKPGVNPSGGPENLILIHPIARIETEQGCNVLFANDKVRYIKKEKLSTLRWTAE